MCLVIWDSHLEIPNFFSIWNSWWCTSSFSYASIWCLLKIFCLKTLISVSYWYIFPRFQDFFCRNGNGLVYLLSHSIWMKTLRFYDLSLWKDQCVYCWVDKCSVFVMKFGFIELCLFLVSFSYIFIYSVSWFNFFWNSFLRQFWNACCN